MKVISYRQGEEFLRGEVVCFTSDIAVVKNDSDGSLHTLNINSLKVIDEPADKPDPRDELIEKYEDALKNIKGWLMRVFENPDHDMVRYIKTDLDLGAEIKKRIENDATN